MTEHPILFSGPMIRAILAGQKTQTRRVIVPPRPCRLGGHHMFYPGERWWVGECPTSGWWAVDDPSGPPPRWTPSGPGFVCPYGVPGDLLWVRETHFITVCNEAVYRADYPNNAKERGMENIPHESDVRWRPSIHMPRWASRLTLCVTDVWVERLQEITIEDVIAEGLSTKLREHDAECDLRDAFRRLWDSNNAKRGYGWDVNPWVWVISFEKVGAA